MLRQTLTTRLTLWVMVLALVCVSFLPKGTMLSTAELGWQVELCTPDGMAKGDASDPAGKLCAFALHQAFSANLTDATVVTLAPLDLRSETLALAVRDLIPSTINRPTWAQGPPILL